MKHILTADQIDRETLDRMEALTNQVRKKRGTREGALWLKSLFPHRRALLYFTQPSSRTFLSFHSACQNLGMDVVEIRSPDTSSEAKGESKLDSIRTFASYVHLIIMRSQEKGLAEAASKHLDGTPRPRPIINAGSGPDQHPTQALLDDYTLRRSLKDRGGIEGKVIVIAGDLKRSRVARSLALLMRFYDGVKIIFASPKSNKMNDDIINLLIHHEVNFEETTDFDWAVSQADAICMLRLQDEYDENYDNEIIDIDGKLYELRLENDPHSEKQKVVLYQSEKSKTEKQRTIEGYNFKKKHLKILKPHGIVMHPLPRREELDTICDNDPRVKIWRQVRNGMHVRTALIYRIMRQMELEMQWGGQIPANLEERCWMLTE